MNTFFEKNKTLIKIGAYIIIGLFALKLAIYLLTPTPQLPDDAKARLKALDNIIGQLEAKQKHYDSLLLDQQHIIDQLDVKIGGIKERTTIIKEYYHEVSGKVDNYKPSQIDSFFKDRYKY